MISGIQYPTHIATGQNGEIVVASYMSHQVHVYNRDYQPLCTFGSNGLIDGQFICPSGIAVDRRNRVYVSSMNKVDIFTIEGQFLNAVGQQGKGPLQFSNAAAIAVGKGGVIYIADTQNNRIQVLNNDLTYRTSFSEGCKVLGSGHLNQPQAVAINSEGNLFVTDTMNHAVQVFSPDGKFLLKFVKYGPATTPGATCTPGAIAIDRHDNVYVGSVTGTISIFDKEGTFLRQFGSYGSELGQFSQIKGMHIDRKGRLYVCEWVVNRIQIFPGSPSMEGPEGDSSVVPEEPESENDTSSSKPAYLIGPKSSQPRKIISDIKEASGVAVGTNGEVVVGSWKDHKVFVFDSKSDYKLIAEVGGGGDEDGKFQYPSGVAITPDNHILVSSYHKLQWFTMDGKLVHSTGSYGSQTSEFDNPSAVAIGRDGRIYILDSNNKRVQVLNGDATYHSSFGFPHLTDEDEDEEDPPSALAISSEGNLYFPDSGKNCVHVFSSSGEPLFKFGKSGSWMERGVLLTPMAIAMDADDNVFVASIFMVSIFDKSGSFIRAFGGYGDDPGQFNFIKGLHIDQHGWLYVSEYNNNRVQIFEGSKPSQPNKAASDTVIKALQSTFSSRMLKPTSAASTDSNTATVAIKTLSSHKPAYMIGPTSTTPVKILSAINGANGIAEGKNGEIIVASRSDNKVFVYSASDYQLVSEIGGKGDIDGRFYRPWDVAVTPDNLILVSSEDKLQWFTMDGKLVHAVGGKGKDAMKFDHPTGVAVGKEGLIYVINENNKRVDILNGDATYNGCFKFTHITSEKDDLPCALAINSEGNLYFPDPQNNCVHVFSSSGKPLFKFGESNSKTERGALSGPMAVAIDTEDNVFVGDYSKVSIFDKSGSFIRGFGSTGENPGQFRRIKGLLIGKRGHLLVSEYNNSRVQIFEGNEPTGKGNPPEKPIKTLFSCRPAYSIGPNSDKPIKTISNVIEPWGVATAPNGNELFVVSKKEKKVLIYSNPDYELKEELNKLYWKTSRDNEVVDPRDIAVLEDGNLLLTLKNQLVKIAASGEVIASVGKKGRRGKDQHELDSPNGIALGKDGKVYIVDSGNSRIQIFNSDLSYKGTAHLPDGLEKSASLEKVAVNSQGLVYVTDKKNNCIHIFDQSGKFLLSFGRKGSSNDRDTFSSPIAIAIDHEDYVYIGTYRDRVSIFDREGCFIRAFGDCGDEPGQFRDIKAMHIDHQGNLFVCESRNTRIQIFAGIKSKDQGKKDRIASADSKEEKLETLLPAMVLSDNIQDPHGVAEGLNGEIIVISSSDHKVFVYDPNCTLLVQFGGKGDLDGQFNHPTSVAVTSDNYILVSSRNKLQWFTMQGQLVYAVGSTGKEHLELNHPDCMALSKDGRIYVLEKQNKRVQVLNGDGTYHSSFSLKVDYPPEALAVNSDGTIFLVDTRSSCIEMFSTDGKYLSKFNYIGTKAPSLPTAVATDLDDNIYVGTANGKVTVFDKVGKFVRAFQGSGNPSCQFNVIRGLHVGQGGRVFVSDLSNNQVQILGEARANTANSDTTPTSPPLAKLLPYRPIFTIGPKSVLPVRILTGIQQPSGIATDPSGNIFIASTRGNKILVYSAADPQPPSEISEIRNPLDPKNKRIYHPSGLFVTNDGYLLVSYEHQLVKMTQNGTVVAFFGNEKNRRGKNDNELDKPGGIAVRKDGQIYLVDGGNHRIQIFQSDLQYTSSLYNPDDKERRSEYLECAALNSAGDLYVTDKRNCNVQVFDNSGKFLFQFGKSGSKRQLKRGQLSNPRGIAIDREDFVYVGGDDGIVSIFDKKGNFVRQFGGFGDQPGQFKEIHGMHIDSTGQLYVCDWKTSQVQVFEGQ